MIISEADITAAIHEVVLDCQGIQPPLNRSEIAEHVIDHVRETIRKGVYSALERMADEDSIVRDRDDAAAGQHYRYRLPRGAH